MPRGRKPGTWAALLPRNDSIISAYVAGESVREIAPRFGVTGESVRRVLKRAGVWSPAPAAQIDDSRFADLWRNGVGVCEMGRQFGTGARRVRLHAALLGLSTRPTRAAAAAAMAAAAKDAKVKAAAKAAAKAASTRQRQAAKPPHCDAPCETHTLPAASKRRQHTPPSRAKVRQGAKVPATTTDSELLTRLWTAGTESNAAISTQLGIGTTRLESEAKRLGLPPRPRLRTGPKPFGESGAERRYWKAPPGVIPVTWRSHLNHGNSYSRHLRIHQLHDRIRRMTLTGICRDEVQRITGLPSEVIARMAAAPAAI